MSKYQVTLTARNFTPAEVRSWVAGHIVQDPGFMTTAVTPGQCPPGNTIFMVYGLDGRQIPMETPQANGWVVFPSNSMWMCLDVVEHETASGEALTFVALVQVPRTGETPHFFMPSREGWKSYCHDFYHRVSSVPWDGRGQEVMPVPETLISLTERCGAIHPYDLKKDDAWATAGPDFVLGSAEGFMRRALGALAVLHDKGFSQESRRAVESVVRTGITYMASEFDGGDASGEVVALRESLLVGHTRGFTGRLDAVSLPWRRAVETFPQWADDKSKVDDVDPTQVAVLTGSRHGLGPNRLNEEWVAAERDWVTRTIGWALGFTDASWVKNVSDLGEVS